MRSIVVGTAGHIDHGKSALVRALTGIDPDRLKEEKARGITIDLGFAHAEIAGINFAFVDVPGHERFVKNMLAGVGGIDLVVLVVAADESVMPQTREHFDICRLLRIPAGLVALTKSDLADDETIELARLEIRDLVAQSFLEGAPVVPVSARDGSGLDAFRAALVQVSARARRRPTDGVTRLPVDRVFSMKGFGTVVTGTLVSGTISPNGDLVVMPGKQPVKVRGVQVHGQRRGEAVAGERAAVNLVGVEVGDVDRGVNLVTAGAFVETQVADASVHVLPSSKPLRHGARVRFHQGTAEVIGRIGIIDPAGRAIAPGSRGFVRIRLESPAVLARGDHYILRAYSPPITIAGGVIVDPLPPHSRIRSASALKRCQSLNVDGDGVDPHESLVRAAATMVADAAEAGLPIEALVSRLGVDPRLVNRLVGELAKRTAAVLAGEVLVMPGIVAHLEESILTALREHHRADRLSEGMPREELRTKRFRRGHAAVYDRALANLSDAGRIVLRDRVALADHRVELSAGENRTRDAIARTYREAALKPPDLATVSAELGITAAVADRIVKLLQRQKVLVRVESLLFHEEALQRLKGDVRELKGSGDQAATIDVATFKERFGVTRKFAIPLLEYLDRERVTRRTGDSRIVL